MKLAAIAHGLDRPSARIRVHQMKPHLAELGIELVAHPFAKGVGERWNLPGELADADVVLVHKELPTFLEGLALRRIQKPLVFDFDDAIFVRKRLRKGTFASRHRARRFARMLSIYDAVIAGNDFLAEPCVAGGVRTLVAPSPVPIDVPRMADRRAEDVARIGWVGLKSNLVYLRALAEPLRALARRARFRLVAISDGELELEGVEVENVRWTLAGQEREIARLDVGVMPLELDSPWSRGKCAYKLLQYMAGGVPVVATDVGMSAQVVGQARCGFLARTDAEWVAHLERLLADRELARELGAAGRACVEREYSYPVIARRWARFLAEVAR